MEKIIDEFCLYLKEQKNKSDETIKTYVREIERLEEFHKNSLLAITEAREAIMLILKIKKEFNHSGRTTYKIATALKVFYDFAQLYGHGYKEGVHPFYFGHGFTKSKSPMPEFFDRDVDYELLNKVLWCPFINLRDKALLWLVYSTGVRRGELVAIDIKDVDLEGRFVRIKKGKGGKFRDVPFDEDCQFWLRAYINSLHYFFPNEEPLFLGIKGKRLNPASVWKIFRKIAERLHLEAKINPHKFRHSLASHLIKKGLDSLIVADILGHESVQTTQIYTHFKKESTRDIYDSVTKKTA